MDINLLQTFTKDFTEGESWNHYWVYSIEADWVDGEPRTINEDQLNDLAEECLNMAHKNCQYEGARGAGQVFHEAPYVDFKGLHAGARGATSATVIVMQYGGYDI